MGCLKKTVVLVMDALFDELGIRAKEIAVARFADGEVVTWTAHIKNNCDSEDLPYAARKQNEFLAKHIHGIHFEYGHMNISSVVSTIKTYCEGATLIVTLGEEQAWYLSRLLNLNVREARKHFGKLPLVCREHIKVTCMHPLHRLNTPLFSCATNRATRLAKQVKHKLAGFVRP